MIIMADAKINLKDYLGFSVYVIRFCQVFGCFGIFGLLSKFGCCFQKNRGELKWTKLIRERS